MKRKKAESFQKNKIDERLRRIANILLLNTSFINDLGLLNGKMGIAIFFYQYFLHTGNKIYQVYANELIDEIYQEINTNTPVGFDSGLTGIGWGIEYLVKNGFVHADTDEALSEIDNIVYRDSLYRPFLLDNDSDLFGYGLYYIARLRERGNDDNNLKTLFKKQHLIYLTDDAERILIQKSYLKFNIKSLSTSTIISFLWFLFEMHHLQLFPTKVELLFHSLPVYIESCLQSSDGKSDKTQLLRLTGNIIPVVADKDLQGTFRTILKKSVGNHLDINTTEDSFVDQFIKNTLNQLIYATYKIKEKSFQEDNVIFSIIDNEINWNRRLEKLNKNNLGLKGLAGIGLGLL